jgi:hypothetical protein
VDPTAIRAQLPDVEHEFKLLMLSLPGSISDVVRAANEGTITPAEMAGFLAMQKGGPNELTPDQQLGVLDKMRALAETDLDLRIKAITAERDAAIKVHTDNIARLNKEHDAAVKAHNARLTTLQKERDAIQKNTQAAIDARQKELDAVNKALQVAEAWQSTLDGIKQTILSLQTGAQSPDTPLQRLDTTQREFDRLSGVLADTHASDKDRQDAASKLTALAPQLLDLAQQGGMAQSSEAYQALYDKVLKDLAAARDIAAGGAKDVEALQRRQVALTEQIAGLQEDQKTQLAAIDASIQAENDAFAGIEETFNTAIQAEQDAITALQEDANAKIQAAQENTANILAYIQGQGNVIFEQKQEALRQELANLGVDSVDLNSIQAASLSELQAIRRILGEAGIDAVPYGGGGAFGLTPEGGTKLQATLKGLTTSGDTYKTLGALSGVTAEDLTRLSAQGGAAADLIRMIHNLFPRTTGSVSFFNAVVTELRKHIENPNYVSDLLGFATGGLVTRPTRGLVGERNRPELIVPLDRAIRDQRFRQAFGDADAMRRALNDLARRSGRATGDVAAELLRLRRDLTTGPRGAAAELARLARSPAFTGGGARGPDVPRALLSQTTGAVSRLGDLIRAARPLPTPPARGGTGSRGGSDADQRERDVEMNLNLNVALSVEGDGAPNLGLTEDALQPMFDRLLRRALARSGTQARIAASTRRRNADAPRP